MKLENMIGKNAVVVSAVPVIACGEKGGRVSALQGPDGSPAMLQMVSCKIVGFDGGSVIVEHEVDTGASKYKNTVVVPLANATIHVAEESIQMIKTPGFISLKS